MEYSSDNENECYDDYYNTGKNCTENCRSVATAKCFNQQTPCTTIIHASIATQIAGLEDIDIEHHNAKKSDPENFVYDCLTVEDVDKLLNESVECLSNIIKCAPSLAKTLLLEHRWCINEVVTKYRENASDLLVSVGLANTIPSAIVKFDSIYGSIFLQISARLKPDTVAAKSSVIRKQMGEEPTLSLTKVNTVPSNNSLSQPSVVAPSQAQIISNCRQPSARSQMCSVCTAFHTEDKFHSIPCEHSFCKDCWSIHFETQINQGISTGIGCMATKCNVLVPEELVLKLLNRPQLRNKYQHFAFQDYVKSHPELRFCPGPNCSVCSLSFPYRRDISIDVGMLHFHRLSFAAKRTVQRKLPAFRANRRFVFCAAWTTMRRLIVM